MGLVSSLCCVWGCTFIFFFFFFQAEDGIRDLTVTGVQTCALPISLRDDFAAVRLPVDVTGFHVYAADWRPGGVDFFVDGDHVRTVEQAPDYPMQMMIGVFDFPMRPSPAADSRHVPLFVIDYVNEA